MNIEAHFDESGTGSDQITVAGYLFESEKISLFYDQWHHELERYGLPYFHMVDCAHGMPPFNTMEKIERIRLQMKLMNLIKRFSIKSNDVSRYKAEEEQKEFMSSVSAKSSSNAGAELSAKPQNRCLHSLTIRD